MEREIYMDLMRRLLQDEVGQGVIEYVVIAAMISIVAIGLVGAVGTKLEAAWNKVLSPGMDGL